MNQEKFNQLVRQFTKVKAAEIVVEELSPQGIVLLKQVKQLNEIKQKLNIELEQKNQSVDSLDKKINLLYNQLSHPATHQEKSIPRADENVL